MLLPAAAVVAVIRANISMATERVARDCHHKGFASGGQAATDVSSNGLDRQQPRWRR